MRNPRPIKSKLTKVGGSVAVIIPRNMAKAMGMNSESKVNLTLVGRNLVLEVAHNTVPKATFRRALATVLRRHASTFRDLAQHDRGRVVLKQA